MITSKFVARVCTAVACLTVVAALGACDGSTSPRRDVQLQLNLVAEGLTDPVLLTAPDNDARLFVIERIGRVRIIKDGTLLPTPFLDISDRVGTVFGRGLLGMAFDPQYATNGRFYVQYVDLGDNIVIERFSSTPGVDLAGQSDGVVISIPHGGQDIHGGTVAFGPDGMLYIAPGYGECCNDPSNNAQNMNVLLGKMLRLDVRTLPYTIPASNPFVGQAGVRPEIWASGLRNPWRFAFDVPSNRLYIADVGETAREEINLVAADAAGLNYGWRLMEGTLCFNPSTNCMTGVSLTMPALEYSHAEGCSVIGGYVYRGAAIRELAGHYFYTDYCEGWLRSFRWTGSRTTDHRRWEGVSLPGVVSFGRDSAGELYMLGGGAVWKIVRQ
jgi:glucose/arabinose dehydrogenase